MKRGFTQGAAGLLVSVLNSYYVFLKMAKAWELDRSGAQAAGRGARNHAGEPRNERGGARKTQNGALPGTPDPAPRIPDPGARSHP